MNFRDMMMARMLGGGGGSGSYSWNDLTDKPFGEGSVSNTIEWDCDPTGRTIIDLGTVTSYLSGSYMVHVSDAVLTKDMCIGCTLTAEQSGEAQEMPIPEGDIDEINGGVAMGTYMVMSTSEPSASLMGFTVNFEKPGTYFFYSPTQSGAVTKAVFTTNVVDNITKLDEKYIPSSIARVSDLEQYAKTEDIQALIDTTLVQYAKTDDVQTLINNAIGTAIGGDY